MTPTPVWCFQGLVRLAAHFRVLGQGCQLSGRALGLGGWRGVTFHPFHAVMRFGGRWNDACFELGQLLDPLDLPVRVPAKAGDGEKRSRSLMAILIFFSER